MTAEEIAEKNLSHFQDAQSQKCPRVNKARLGGSKPLQSKLKHEAAARNAPLVYTVKFYGAIFDQRFDYRLIELNFQACVQPGL
jgi:hypothetical protein